MSEPVQPARTAYLHLRTTLGAVAAAGGGAGGGIAALRRLLNVGKQVGIVAGVARSPPAGANVFLQTPFQVCIGLPLLGPVCTT
jgi:hypothetical protein